VWLDLFLKRWGTLVALIWGAAEATFLFIVPDVWFCGVAVVRGWKAGLAALAAAWMGALAGGGFLYVQSSRSPESQERWVRQVIGVTPTVLERADRHLAPGGVGMVCGGFTFLPYKAYAVRAPLSGMNLATFVRESALSRGSRFLTSLGLTLLAAWLLTTRGPVWTRNAPPRRLHLIHVVFWLGIYAIYLGFVVPRL
jgi:hypothetical protein